MENPALLLWKKVHNILYVAVTAITDTTVAAGSTVDVAVTSDPADASIAALSSDEAVATATVTGSTITLTGVAAGTATITVGAAKEGYNTGTASFGVTVTEATVPDTIAVEAITVEEYHTATPVVAITNTAGDDVSANYTLTYAVDTAAVASVATTGVVTGGAYVSTANTATLTVTATPAEGDAIVATATITVTDDTTAPTVESIEVIDATHINVVFSEKVIKTGAEDVSNYDVRNIAIDNSPVDLVPGTDTAVLGDDAKTVAITLVTGTAVLTVGDYYLVMDQTGTTATVQDLAGNAVATNASKTFTGVAATDATAPTVTSCRYDAASNQLDIYFSEPIKTASLSKTGFSITDGTDTVTLTINETAAWSNGNQKLSLTLMSTTATSVEALGAARTLSVADAAVTDNASTANSIAAASGITVSQTTILTAATYDEASNLLTLTFNNAVDVSTLVITEFTLDGSSSTALDSSDTVSTTADGTTVEITMADDAGLATYEGSGVTSRNVDFTGAAATFVDTEEEAVAATSNVTLTYTEDTTVPTLVSAAFNASTNRLTLTFSEKIDVSEFSATGIKFSGGTHTLNTALLETTDATVATFNHATDFDTEGGNFVPASTTQIYFNASAFKDMAGNGNAAVTSTNATDISYGDQTPPTVSAFAQVSTNIAKVTFDSEVSVATGNVAGNYAIAKTDNPAVTIDVTGATVAEDQLNVYLTLGSTLVNGYGYTVTVSNVEDLYGNVIASNNTGNFTANTTADTTGPALADTATSVAFADVDSSYTVNTGDTITLTFTEPVQISGVVAADFTVTGFSGSSSNNFGTSPTFAIGDTNEELVITLGATPKLQASDLGTATINSAVTSHITDLAGNSCTATSLGGNDVIDPPDATAPYITAAVYTDQNADGKVSAGDYLTLTFSEAMDTTVDFSTLANTDFAYTGGNDTVGSGSLAPAYLSSTEMRLTLGTSPELDGAGTTLEYITSNSTLNTTGSPAELKDLWGNIAAAASSALSISSADSTRPYITAAEYIDNNTAGVTSGDTVTVTFNEPVHLVSGGTVDENDFYVSNGGSLGTSSTTAMGSSNSQIVITLGTSPALSVGNSAINITAAGCADIRDASGNQAVQYSSSATIEASASTGDTTAPTFATAVTGDNDGNGQVDRLVITFSESVTITDGDAGDGLDCITLSGGYSIANADYAGSGTTLTLQITESGSADTDATIDPTYATAGTNTVTDSALNEIANSETVTGTDGAAPVLLTYDVADGAGAAADEIDVTFSEAVYSDTSSTAFVATGTPITIDKTAVDGSGTTSDFAIDTVVSNLNFTGHADGAIANDQASAASMKATTVYDAAGNVGTAAWVTDANDD